MGYSEYDRIRSKNKLQNEAYEQYLRLKQMGLSDSQIAGVCSNLNSIDIFSNSEFRHNIIKEIEKIVGTFNV